LSSRVCPLRTGAYEPGCSTVVCRMGSNARGNSGIRITLGILPEKAKLVFS
jgi:hypothetical protein